MTLKEAVLKSLEDINDITNYWNVLEHIKANDYYDFGEAKTPGSTISAVLGDFIRNGDSRVKRIKRNGSTYSYYLTKNEANIDLELLSGEQEIIETDRPKSKKDKTFNELSLHKLLSSFLIYRNVDILLSYAEANLGTNKKPEMLVALNKIRTAANMDQLQELPLKPEYEIASLWAKIIGTDHGYFALLKRLGIIVELLNIKSYEQLYPIPLSELYMNPNMTQNPGY